MSGRAGFPMFSPLGLAHSKFLHPGLPLLCFLGDVCAHSSEYCSCLGVASALLSWHQGQLPGCPGEGWDQCLVLTHQHVHRQQLRPGYLSFGGNRSLLLKGHRPRCDHLVAAQARTTPPWSEAASPATHIGCSSRPSSLRFCLFSLCPLPSASPSRSFLHHSPAPLSGARGLLRV